MELHATCFCLLLILDQMHGMCMASPCLRISDSGLFLSTTNILVRMLGVCMASSCLCTSLIHTCMASS